METGTGVLASQASTALTQLPTWLSARIPPEVLPHILSGIQSSAQVMKTSLPWAETAVSWLVPLIWVGWLSVVALTILATIVVHVLIRRLRGKSLQGPLDASMHRLSTRA